MTPELKQRIEKEAKAYAKSLGRKEIGYYALNYEAGATAWAEEVERLERWKAEAQILLDTIFEYGQSHPDIKLGTSCIEFVLNRAKAYDTLLERAEKLREALEEIQNYINEEYHPSPMKIRTIAETALEQYKKETQ